MPAPRGDLQRHLEAQRGGGQCPLHGGTSSNSAKFHGLDSVGMAVKAADKGNESDCRAGGTIGLRLLGTL